MTTANPHPRGSGLPTLQELDLAPQLAVVVALDAALELASLALEVAHPEIDDDPECPYWVARPDRLAAQRLLALFERLRAAIARYRAALPDTPSAQAAPQALNERPPTQASDADDGIPF